MFSLVFDGNSNLGECDGGAQRVPVCSFRYSTRDLCRCTISGTGTFTLHMLARVHLTMGLGREISHTSFKPLGDPLLFTGNT